MALIFAPVSPPVVVHISSGPSWLVFALTLLGTFLAGTATALLIQLCVVPRVETRKRREDRWERDVRELNDVLTTTVTGCANEARQTRQVVSALLEDQDRHRDLLVAQVGASRRAWLAYRSARPSTA